MKPPHSLGANVPTVAAGNRFKACETERTSNWNRAGAVRAEIQASPSERQITFEETLETFVVTLGQVSAPTVERG